MKISLKRLERRIAKVAKLVGGRPRYLNVDSGIILVGSPYLLRYYKDLEPQTWIGYMWFDGIKMELSYFLRGKKVTKAEFVKEVITKKLLQKAIGELINE